MVVRKLLVRISILTRWVLKLIILILGVVQTNQIRYNLKWTHKSNKQIYIDFGNNKMGYIKFIDTKIIFYNNYSNTISLRYNGSRYLLIEITKDQFLQKFSQ